MHHVCFGTVGLPWDIFINCIQYGVKCASILPTLDIAQVRVKSLTMLALYGLCNSSVLNSQLHLIYNIGSMRAHLLYYCIKNWGVNKIQYALKLQIKSFNLMHIRWGVAETLVSSVDFCSHHVQLHVNMSRKGIIDLTIFFTQVTSHASKYFNCDGIASIQQDLQSVFRPETM